MIDAAECIISQMEVNEWRGRFGIVLYSCHSSCLLWYLYFLKSLIYISFA